MTNRHLRFLACTALGALMASSPTLAQDAASTAATKKQGRVTVLQAVSVVGGSTATGVADTPLAETTEAEELERKQITSFEDLGRTVEPGVNFNRTTGSVNIRGLEGPRVLTTIDGIRLPYLQDVTRGASGGGDSFDFSTLSTVDVVRGADSSRAGSGALGGVVVLRTLEPEDLIGDDKTWGGVFKLAYDSADTSFSTSAAVAARTGNTSVLFQGSYKAGHERSTRGTFDGYSTARTEANPADFDQDNVLFKVKQETETGHTFGLTAERFRRDKETDLRTSQSPTGNLRPDNYDGTEINERDRVSLDYQYEAQSADSLIDNARATLYWQSQLRASGLDGYRFTSVVGPYSRLNDYEESGIGFTGSADKTFLTGDLEHRVTVGLDLYGSKADQYSSGVDSCPTNGVYTGAFAACSNLHTNQSDMPDVDGRSFAAYLEDRITIGETGLTLTPGLRFDWYEQVPKETPEFLTNANYLGLPPSSSDSAISPKLLATYQATPDIELYGQWAMGFRAPTTGELYANFGAPGTYFRGGNPNLKPETSNGFEIGANLGDESFGGSVSLFYNRYSNFIDSVNLTTAEQTAAGIAPGTYPFFVARSINRAKVRIYGAELEAHKQFDNGLWLGGALAYANGKDQLTGGNIETVAPLKAALTVGYRTETWGTDVTLTGVASARGETVRSNTGAITDYSAPGYGIVDLTAWWEPEQVAGLKVSAGIFNVFDKTYYDAVNVKDALTQPESYYSEPGRTFKISLVQKF